MAIETASTLDDVRTPPADTVAIVNLPHPVDPAPYPSLRWIHTATAGIDAFLTPSLLERDVTLTSSAGNGGIALAEHALMLMMMLGRDTSRWYRAQQHKQWDRYPHGELAGRTVVIVGMGAVGRDLARKAVACHMRVIGVTRRPHDPIEDVDQIVTSDHLVDVAAEADFLVVAAPLTPSTTGLVGESVLAMLPAHAFVVCVSRGGIIDEDALIARLSDSRLAGAGLDAHEIEPLPAQSALWTLPNVIITPHNGATTDGTARRGEQILLDNVARFVNDQPLRNIVDATAGY
ncbi:D-2-hydroxyacid dehydrogenase [Rhodococcus pseudokoreensis]|uniref:D-2-hydroxyacid dehydrogenase n=1 Tax=Rhodococcus pseudokoreensis TaxID=2811421 RepID=A0A974ZU26_9NOCA|nr:D-2-hydroxyacid dehydrogenase [Rhodococcus pseudokoreensis]QSE89817.1 D-2-hydroxyacid dehydrogenase [Rhodococcus pseudokoreensis]